MLSRANMPLSSEVFPAARALGGDEVSGSKASTALLRHGLRKAVLAEDVTYFNHHRPRCALNQAAPRRSLPSATSPSHLRVQR
jgi:hypothetical protein